MQGENMLHNDESYQERAIDVPVDCRDHQYIRRIIQECNPYLFLWSKVGENNDGSKNMESSYNDEIQTALYGDIKKSSPVKDYTTSTVHNVEFESLVSEPVNNTNSSRGYSTYTFDDVNQSAQENILCNQTARSAKCEVISTSKELQGNDLQHAKVTQHRNCPNSVLQKNKVTDIHENESHSCRKKPEKLGSDHFSKESYNYKKKAIHKQMNNTVTKKSNLDCTIRSVKEQENINFGRGSVGQKIIAYEDNVRRNKLSHDDELCCVSGVNKYRTIGVPLVGMHNACGLPVFSSWHGDNLRSLRINRRIVNRAPRSMINKRSGKNYHPLIKTATIISRNSSLKCKKNSVICSLKKNCHVPEKVSVNQQMTTAKSFKCGTLPSKRHGTYSLDTSRYGYTKYSYIGSFSRKPFKKRSSKRKTLYARNDGEEAVQVLKNLCLNPLARNKSGVDMMW